MADKYVQILISVRFSNGGSHLVLAIRNPDRTFLTASLDRFGIKKYFIYDSFLYKTVYTSNRTQMSGFRSVRISNGRDWHKIQSEYRPRFGIRWPTVVTVCC